MKNEFLKYLAHEIDPAKIVKAEKVSPVAFEKGYFTLHTISDEDRDGDPMLGGVRLPKYPTSGIDGVSLIQPKAEQKRLVVACTARL